MWDPPEPNPLKEGLGWDKCTRGRKNLHAPGATLTHAECCTSTNHNLPPHAPHPTNSAFIQLSQPTQLSNSAEIQDRRQGAAATATVTLDVQRRPRRSIDDGDDGDVEDGNDRRAGEVSTVLLRSHHHQTVQLLGGSLRRRRRCNGDRCSDDGDAKSRREAGRFGGGESGGGRWKPRLLVDRCRLRRRRRRCSSAIAAAHPASPSPSPLHPVVDLDLTELDSWVGWLSWMNG
ncbi:hypothetical protein LWI29_019882 [Acer saccharum]|uniref:Uncharacterized protein n=1 Tax=Acer saccharum TaxID=4024 RepID=A0AA39TFA0_ACESA|nr:hypothetical protein LWI29_019882 [Acer saccharum]